MWIYCQDCSVLAPTGAGSGTSATHLAVSKRDEKIKSVERILGLGGGGENEVF